ncbi:hypothetical protein QU593_10300 [Rossellomorea marisflavi]|uniref:hypothetical protein n=1 Tax=Rossellomorea marisflavi TaxID=189381 RepID=UPI0025AF4EBB|nr:hypothetical protein [Rossellomorea marisflavi]WJV20796.1 hypothetical protein QU593_10300 [Rossellomorea marisflavi]
MSNEPFIDFILNSAENKMPRFILRKLLKLPTIVPVNIDFSDKSKPQAVQNELKFIALLKSYKDKGFSKNETLQSFQDQMALYPAMEIQVLPKLVYDYWDELE